MARNNGKNIYQALAEYARTQGGVLTLSDPHLDDICGAGQARGSSGRPRLYRIPTYIWEIRTKLGLNATPVRLGRKVVAYQFPALMTPSPTGTWVEFPASPAATTGTTDANVTPVSPTTEEPTASVLADLEAALRREADEVASVLATEVPACQ